MTERVVGDFAGGQARGGGTRFGRRRVRRVGLLVWLSSTAKRLVRKTGRSRILGSNHASVTVAKMTVNRPIRSIGRGSSPSLLIGTCGAATPA